MLLPDCLLDLVLPRARTLTQDLADDGFGIACSVVLAAAADENKPAPFIVELQP